MSSEARAPQESDRFTWAVRTLDCARKVRVHYLLPEPIGEALLTLFRGARVERQEFSRFVQGAKDHFTVTGSAFRASGVLGDRRLVVTFVKVGPDRAPVGLDEFERLLCVQGGWGPLRHRSCAQSGD